MLSLRSRLESWSSLATMKRAAVLTFAVTCALYVGALLTTRGSLDPAGALPGVDFIAFYMAGDMVSQGRIDQLYDSASQTAWQAEFMRSVDPRWTGTCLFLNPPHYAGALSLLARLDYTPALAIWSALSLTCFVITLQIWRRWVSPDLWSAVVVLTISSPPWFQAFAGGQNTFISLLILSAFCDLMLQGRHFLAGLVLSVLAFKFQLLVAPVALLLFARRWRTLTGLALGSALTVGLTALLMGPHVLIDYARFTSRLGDLMHLPGFDVHQQHSWYGFFQLLCASALPSTAVRGLTCAAIFGSLTLLAVLWRLRPSDAPLHAFQLSGLVVAVLLASPHVFQYDMLLAVPAVILWLRAARDSAPADVHRTFRRLAIAGFFWLAIAGPTTQLLPLQLTPLLLVVWLISLWRHSRRMSARDSQQSCFVSLRAQIG
jgi:glycosyl transferase family 87